MKRMKIGFTLAEVLITLAIIGVIAAIVLPSVMSNYQYKAMGTKIAKFVSSTEGATRAYVLNDGNFDGDTGVANFIDSSLLVNDIVHMANGRLIPGRASTEEDEGGATQEATTTRNGYVIAQAPAVETLVTNRLRSSAGRDELLLKDGTSLTIGSIGAAEDWDAADAAGLNLLDTQRSGNPAFIIILHTNVQGIPNTVRTSFHFTVTDTGNLLPRHGDNCTIAIYKDSFITRQDAFVSANGVCAAPASTD